MDCYKYLFNCIDEQVEILIALLAELPFDVFEEKEYGFDAFINSAQVSEEVEDRIRELSLQFHFTWSRDFIPGQNWNKIWESNFQPVVVDDFCGIRADFHPAFSGVEFELVINPKMAFGTGHHETTHLVIQIMRELNFNNATVLDYGCGTGILGILASKMGAKQVFAVDIEEQAWLNTVENCEVNGVNNINAVCGNLEAVPEKTYDVVLANINRNVILDSLHSLSKLIKTGSTLIFSGFMPNDETVMREGLEQFDIQTVEVRQRNNWMAFKCTVL